jgi:hypothetical protein
LCILSALIVFFFFSPTHLSSLPIKRRKNKRRSYMNNTCIEQSSRQPLL